MGSGSTVNLLTGWIGILAGVVSGGIIGLFFHREDWLGGYASFPRRLARLGHISFFGLGFVNLAFGLTAHAVSLSSEPAALASVCLILGAVSMPLCCFLAAWKKPLRHLFPFPVGCVLLGLLALLRSWPWP